MAADDVLTAEAFVRRLAALRPADRPGDEPYAGIGMGQIFALAKEYMAMAPAEIERLLESPITRSASARSASWTGRRATGRRPPIAAAELFDLYIRRHDRIDTWDLVDRSAIWVVGEYLVDKPRDVLYRLARSEQPMERRTAILSTFAFIRRGELEDAYRIAEWLVDDRGSRRTRQSAGCCARPARGTPKRHAAFLEAHAATMPRVMLRYAIEKLDKPERDRYLAMKGLT